MGYTCPLCQQSVSFSSYQKIMGIWEERRRLLEKVKAQREKLLKKLKDERSKYRDRLNRLRTEKAEAVRRAVGKRTKRLESRINALRRREERIERNAQRKLKRATAKAHAEARRVEAKRYNSLRKELRASLGNQLKEERERVRLRFEGKSQRLRRTCTNLLNTVEIKDKQLREQSDEMRELRQQLDRQTTPQIEGFLYEDKLTRELRKEFPKDKVEHKGKGGDVIQTVTWNGKRTGVIVYECKRVKRYSVDHVKQAYKAREQRNADFAILVTKAMKKGTQGFFVEKGIILVHPAGVISIAKVLREHIIQIDEMKLGQAERDKAIKLTLEYIEGTEFSHSMDAIIQESVTLYECLRDEMKKHYDTWKRRYGSYKKVHEEAIAVKSITRARLSGEPEYKKLVENNTLPALPELPEHEKTISVIEGIRNSNHKEERSKSTEPPS